MLTLARRMAGAAIRRVPWLRRQVFASVDYAVISRDDAARGDERGWMSPLTVRRQQRAYDRLLARLRAGSVRVDLAVAAEAVRATGLRRPGILEVGCGGGMHAEVFERLLQGEFEYCGVDYSPAMIRFARIRYPNRRFEVGDATDLPFPAESTDVVFDGVALMHVRDPVRAIAEAARVSRAYCVYHSVPVFDEWPTTYLRKYAYGAPVTETVFNRAELLTWFAAHGLSLVRAWRTIPYDVHAVVGAHSHCETFLLEKAAAGAPSAASAPGPGAGR